MQKSKLITKVALKEILAMVEYIKLELHEERVQGKWRIEKLEQ